MHPDVHHTLLRTMTKDLKNEKRSGELKAKLWNLANTYVSNYRPLKYDMKKHGIFKQLYKNNDIVILQPDNGDGTAIYLKDVWDNKRSYKTQIVKNRFNNNKGRSAPKVFKIYERQKDFY